MPDSALHLFNLWLVPLLAQADARAPDSLLELLMNGGWAMWPLAFCSVAFFFLVFWAMRETQTKRFLPLQHLHQIRDDLERAEIEQAQKQLAFSETMLSRALAVALTKYRPHRPDRNREKVEATLVEQLEAEEAEISQKIHYLNVVAAVAPMIGLLGTVSGMIGAFGVIAEGGMGKPELLAGNIGEALITTATGLSIGIPAMIFYFVFRNRLGSRMVRTAQVATEFLDQCFEEQEDPLN